MNRQLRWIIVLGVVFTGQIARADDAADVKAAARAFVEAAQIPDVAKMKQSVTSASGAVIDSMAAYITASQKMNAAAQAKFNQNVQENPFSPQLLEKYDGADVKVDGDTAILTPKTEANSKSPQPPPLTFKRENQGWKLDMMASGLPAETLNKGYLARASAALETAGEISDGKYASVGDARAAYRQKVRGDR
jgi:hypothetical protein